MPEKFTVNKEKIEVMLDVMTNLKASGIPEQRFENTVLNKIGMKVLTFDIRME